MQVHSNTHRPLFGLTKGFHVGGSTLRKLSHHAESSTTFNYFTQRSQVCKNKKSGETLVSWDFKPHVGNLNFSQSEN